MLDKIIAQKREEVELLYQTSERGLIVKGG
jgi:hypothetical protein